MKSIITILVSLIVQTSLANVSINGAIFKTRKANPTLITKTGAKYKIISKSDYIKDIISSLETGDEIIAVGTRTKTSVTITEIDFVNLKNMIGSWLSDDGKIYKFENEKNFKLEVVDATGNVTSTYNFYYTVSPTEQKNKWNLLFSNETRVNFAELIIINDEMYLNFINPDTGRVTHTQHLNKIK